MASIEDKIKDIIIDKYSSIAEFSRKSKIPYTTIDSMLKRGIKNANVLNVIKLCDALEISVDKIKDGIIEPVQEFAHLTPEDFYLNMRRELERISDDVLSQKDKEKILSDLAYICLDDEK